MPNIIRKQSDVETASMADLVHTHNALRGESIDSFPSIEVARTRVRLDILSAENEVGKLGVREGERPVAKTVAELGFNPYKPGTMSHALYEAVNNLPPIEPRPRRSEIPADSRPASKPIINVVRATFAGTSKPQASSVRAAVLRFIQSAPGNYATVDEMERHFGHPVRGYLQKLLEKNHIEIVTETATE